tara:strand:- start:70 stop:1206 length:1137 start_codon:yes stop_codon:yes gene_type:complete
MSTNKKEEKMSTITETRTVKISEATTLITRAFKKKRPVFLWGPPGIGKSELVQGIGDSGELGSTLVIDMRLALFEPTDLRGYPVPDVKSGVMKWLPPADLPSKEVAAQYDTVIVFLDEMNSAAPSVQAAGYQLILNRRIGQYELPDNVVMIAAGNRETDKGVTYRMPKPLENRFVHFELRVDFQDWLNWAVQHDIDADVVGYLSFAKGDLYNFDPASSSRGFATPRAWTFTSELIEDADDLADGLQTDLVAGCVGEGVAVKFMAHRKIAGDLPDPVEVLDGKVKTMQSTEISAKYALATSLCYELRDRSITGEKSGKMDKYHKSFSNMLGFMMDNFETEMVIMASRVAMQQYKLVPKQDKIERFEEYFSRYGRLVLDA